MTASYTRIWTDDRGDTHFAEGSAELASADFAPPAPPMLLSGAFEASEVRFLSAPAGWDSVPHPTPRRQFVIILRGSVESVTSDGEARRFAPGDVVLLEDTAGAGHSTRVLGEEDWLAAVIPLG